MKENKNVGNNNAWKNEARKLFKLPEEEREAKLEAINIGEKGMQKVQFLRQRFVILEEEAAKKAAERTMVKPATVTMAVETKTEEKSSVENVKLAGPMLTETKTVVETKKVADPAIKAGLDEVKGLLRECETIESRLKEYNPASRKKTESKTASKPFSLEDRIPGMVLWQYTPKENKVERNGGKIMSNGKEEVTPGLMVIQDKRKENNNSRKKKVRKLTSSTHSDEPEKVPEQMLETISEVVKDHIFHTFESVSGKAPDRSFTKELQNGGVAIGKRYRLEGRYNVVIPANVLGRECKQFPEKNGKPAYTWRTIFVSGTTLRINVNLRRSKDGTILEPVPNADGDIVGEAEIGYNVSMKNGKIYAIQYMNIYAPNGATGDMYRVYANLSRGEQKPGNITIGPSMGTYVKSKQDEKTADAEIILHLDKLPATQ